MRQAVAIDMVEAGDRLRAINADQVAALMDSIAEVGLLNPITVYSRQVLRGGVLVPGYGLVAGAHRLEACRRLGLVEIEAQVVDLPELKRQLAECDENLCGTKLTAAMRALFTRRRKEIYEALYPETRHGGDRGASRKLCDLDQGRFTASTAAATGRAERTVQLDATRGERIAADVLADVSGTELDKGVVLDALSRLPVEKQAAAVAEMRAKPVPPPPPIRNDAEAEDMWIASMRKLWNKGAKPWRERFLDEVA